MSTKSVEILANPEVPQQDRPVDYTSIGRTALRIAAMSDVEIIAMHDRDTNVLRRFNYAADLIALDVASGLNEVFDNVDERLASLENRTMADIEALQDKHGVTATTQA